MHDAAKIMNISRALVSAFKTGNVLAQIGQLPRDEIRAQCIRDIETLTHQPCTSTEFDEALELMNIVFGSLRTDKSGRTEH